MARSDVPSAGAAPFIGRERELSELTVAIDQPSSRLVTITGLPGIGKTRLAAQAARLLDGRWHCVPVSLADLTETTEFTDAVLAARRLAHVMTRATRPTRRELLILDNAEHLPGVADRVAALRSPSACVLVTSTRPLGLSGERVLRLGPLEPVGSVTLFVELATSGSVGFRVVEADTPAVAELCELLGRVPLAIELAAAHAGTLPVTALLERLRPDAGLGVPSRLMAERAPERHHTMRQALAWSYRLVEPQARLLLRALAVFADTFTVSDAAAVVRGDDVGDVAEGLSTLVDCHFVEPVGEGADAGRYRMLPPIRQFCRELLAAGKEIGTIEARHTLHVSRLGRRAATSYRRGDHASAFTLLRQEWPEIVAVQGRLLRQARTPDRAGRKAAKAGLRLTVDCAPYLLDIGHDVHGHVRFEQFIALGRDAGADADLLTRALLWSAVLGRLDQDPRFDRDWASARLAEGLRQAEELGNTDALLLGWEMTALATTITGDLDAAESAIQRALALPSLGEGRRARFEALACMLAHHRGDLQAAEELAVTAAGRAVRHDDQHATLLVAMAALGLPAGRATAAARLLPPDHEILDLARRTGDRHAEEFLLGMVAGRRLALDDLAGAASAAAEHLSLLLARDATGTVQLGVAVTVLAVVAVHRGEFEHAAELFGSVGHLDEAVHLVSTPEGRESRARAAVAARAALGPRRWDVAWRRGAARSPDQATVAGLDYAGLVGASAAHSPDRAAPPPVRPVQFRRRELDVLRGMASGRTNKEIAAELGLTPKTVMHYSCAVYDKLGVRGRAAATAWAVRNGVVPSD